MLTYHDVTTVISVGLLHFYTFLFAENYATVFQFYIAFVAFLLQNVPKFVR